MEGRGGGDYLPIGADPDLQAARVRAINQVVAPDTEPPPPEHPAVTYARTLLSPMGPYGGPSTVSMPPGFNPYAAPADQRGAAQGGGAGFTVPGNYQYPAQPIVGPDLSQIGNDPSNPVGWLNQQLAKVGETPTSKFQLPGLTQVAGLFPGSTLGDIGGLFAPPTQAQTDNPLFALGPEGNFAGNIGEALGPAARMVGNKVLGGAQDVLKGRLPEFASQAAGEGRPDLGLGGPQSNLERMIAEGKDFTKVPKAEAAASEAANPSIVGQERAAAGPRYTAEVGKTRSYVLDTQTGNTVPGTINMSKDHAAVAQAKADALNAPTPVNPFAVPQEASVQAAVGYVTKAKANPVGDTVGDVVRRAARANPEIVTPDFLAKQPDVRTQIDQALTTAKLPPTDENAAAVAQQLLAQEKARPSVGNLNAQKVRDALGEEPPISFGPEPPATPPAVPPHPPTGGAMPPDVPLPVGPPKAVAGGLALETLRFLTDIPRSLMVIGHLPILRQGLPLMADAVVRGNPGEIPQALGRAFDAAIASPMRAAAITQGFRDTLESAGVKVGRDGVAITDPVGAIAAREEFGLHSFLARVPVISNLNRIYPTMLNSLRTGAALDLAKIYEQSGRPIDSARIGHFVNIASGRGDIPAILDTPAGREILSGVFFGPRLTTSSWQMATDTVGALRNVTGDVLARRALDPVEIAQIRTVAAYVATGVGIMKIANAFGMPIGIDPTQTDFGRITLPDGKRVDLWGPFNENARLIAREIQSIQSAVQGKPAYGATTGLDQIVSYFRSKLNAGVPTAVGDVLAGSTQGGQSLQEAYGTPEALRSKLLPLPFAGQEAISGSSMGPGMEALETGLVGAGATVIDQPARAVFDGLGKPSTDPAAGNDPVLQEYSRLMKEDPNFAKEPLQPPSTTIGSGRNSIKLPVTEEAKYVQAVGEQRRVLLGALIYSQDYQNATVAQQEKMFKDTQAVADRQGNVQYLAHGVIDSTDPRTIAAEAVAGFHSQGGNTKNEAYWVALLDRAGKLTPDVVRAIDDSNVSKPGQKAPITVEEYRKAAPLVHEYLGHVPYGTDTKPVGTPADWTAVAQAHVAKNTRTDELVRSGVNPTAADVRAQAEILKSLPSMVQRNLFLNGTQLENPLRRAIALKNPTLKRFLGPNPQYTRESEAEYQNFPFGQ